MEIYLHIVLSIWFECWHPVDLSWPVAVGRYRIILQQHYTTLPQNDSSGTKAVLQVKKDKFKKNKILTWCAVGCVKAGLRNCNTAPVKTAANHFPPKNGILQLDASYIMEIYLHIVLSIWFECWHPVDLSWPVAVGRYRIILQQHYTTLPQNDSSGTKAVLQVKKDKLKKNIKR